MQLVYDLSLPAAGLASMLNTLCLFHWLDRLVSERRKRSCFFRLSLGALSGAVAMLGLSAYPVYSRGTPTVFLILLLDVLSVVGHEFLSKDRQSVYHLFGSAVFFNHFMIYMLVYSLYHTLPYGIWEVGGGLGQRVIFIFACAGCMVMFALVQVKAFPTEEVKELLHSKEGLLLKIWLPATSWILFGYSIGLLPRVEAEIIDSSLEIGIYAAVFQWALSCLLSGYIITLYQAWQIRSRNQAQGELKKIQKNTQELKVQADRHPLTGLLNRRAWERKVREALAQEKTGYMIMLDLDHFKAVNDNLGHMEGDLILKETADMLQRIFRKTDLIGHIGGDEFCIFFVNELEQAIVERRLYYLLNMRRKRYQGKHGGSFLLSFSAGCAEAPLQEDGEKAFERLLAAADAALYWQKEHGRDGYTMYREGMEDVKK